MPVIDGDGLSGGKRLRRCSDRARLYWPYLFCTSNGYGRFEVDCTKIIAHCFLGFKTPPTEAEVLEVIEEYEAVGLLFLWRSRGEVWAQWDTKDRYLKRHKTASDKDSPIPPETEFSDWKRSTVENKEFPKFSAQVGAKLRGIGKGIGNGIGKGKTSSPKTGSGELFELGLVPLSGQPSSVLDGNVESDTKCEPSTEIPGKPGSASERTDEAKRLAETFAPAIHKRHVSRKCSLRITTDLIAAILRKHPTDRQRQLAETIDWNHKINCESWEWTKDGGQFCPGLEKWLNPSKDRFLEALPIRANPLITQVNFRDKAIQMLARRAE